MAYKIRSKYVNPPHMVGEDYSLIPRLVDDSRYEPLDVMVARFCRGEPVYAKTYDTVGDVDYHDCNVEDVHAMLVTAQEQAHKADDKTSANGVNANQDVVPPQTIADKSDDSTEKKE